MKHVCIRTPHVEGPSVPRWPWCVAIMLFLLWPLHGFPSVVMAGILGALFPILIYKSVERGMARLDAWRIRRFLRSKECARELRAAKSRWPKKGEVRPWGAPTPAALAILADDAQVNAMLDRAREVLAIEVEERRAGRSIPATRRALAARVVRMERLALRGGMTTDAYAAQARYPLQMSSNPMPPPSPVHQCVRSLPRESLATCGCPVCTEKLINTGIAAACGTEHLGDRRWLRSQSAQHRTEMVMGMLGE